MTWREQVERIFRKLLGSFGVEDEDLVRELADDYFRPTNALIEQVFIQPVIKRLQEEAAQ